jgi:hypothetical protein
MKKNFPAIELSVETVLVCAALYAVSDFAPMTGRLSAELDSLVAEAVESCDSSWIESL